MNEYLGIRTDELKRRNCYWTAREICQQPGVWRETHAKIDASRKEVDAWLMPALASPDLRILLCGAGTSAYIGETAAAWLRRQHQSASLGYIASVSTTDLTADPEQYLSNDAPTLMISFARSGDSPESLACVELADQLLTSCRHLVLTCNPDGRLAGFAEDREDALCLMMPEQANDRSFVMTSSFTTLLVACLAIFTPDRTQLEKAAIWAEYLLGCEGSKVADLARLDIRRLVVLGAGSLAATAAEAALKCLELTGGEVVAMHETPLGFRHGPKLVIDGSTLVVHLRSNDPHIALYDQDLLRELTANDRAAAIVEVSPATLAPEFVPAAARLGDAWLSLAYIVFCQMLAFQLAVTSGTEADNPCATGEVNRVVDGVTIYPFKRPVLTATGTET